MKKMTLQQLRKVISANVRRQRGQLHMTQVDLAIACDCTQAHISRMEKGLTGCSDEMLAKLSEALGCHPAALMMEGGRAEKLKLGA